MCSRHVAADHGIHQVSVCISPDDSDGSNDPGADLDNRIIMVLHRTAIGSSTVDLFTTDHPT